MNRAAEIFAALEMHKTEARNGVLLYLATKDRKFAIIGDGGINEKVAENFWQSTYDSALPHFKSDDFTKGLCSAIKSGGEVLSEHFPYLEDDVNELDEPFYLARVVSKARTLDKHCLLVVMNMKPVIS